MDAGSRTALGLLAEMNVRYLVPAYQRPYSWDEARACARPWTTWNAPIRRSRRRPRASWAAWRSSSAVSPRSKTLGRSDGSPGAWR